MKEITLDAVVKNVPELTDFIDRELEAVGCPLRKQMQLDIAVDEIFSNVAYYAYPSGTGKVTVAFDYEEETRTVILIFRDSGIPYNPMNAKEPDVTLSAEERQIGGLGIFMVKKSMDAMIYEYRDGMNILTLRKNIG